jgi:hypothetical protein
MLAPALLLACVVVGAAADDVGFGGASVDVEDAPDDAAYDNADDVAERDDSAIIDDVPVAVDRSGDFTTGALSRTLPAFPEPTEAATAPKKTPLELELERARMDPSQHPLLMVRVEAARARMALEDGRKGGLFSIKDEEAALAKAAAILADVERIALHRMNVCMTRQGKQVVVKSVRMTAAGPVRLSTAELLAQASPVDPDGCGRIFLVDQALVDRVRRAHELQHILTTTKFGYHEVKERRALEDEAKSIAKALGNEDLPIISMPGATDPYGR